MVVDILVAHGVNMDLLGLRSENHYGSKSLNDLNIYIESKAKKIFPLFNINNYNLCFFQSNNENLFLEKIVYRNPYYGSVQNSID